MEEDMESKLELYIVRHGKTDWNEMEKLQGRADIDLNYKGREAAGNLGKRLEDVFFDAIYSSPLIRAYDTAALIRGHRNIPIIRDERLIEISFGVSEGTIYREWLTDDSSFKAFFHHPEKYIPPKNGESFESVIKRTKDFLNEVIENLYGKAERIMVVAHGALVAGLTSAIENRSIENYWGDGLFKNCEEKIYSFDGKRWKKA